MKKPPITMHSEARILLDKWLEIRRAKGQLEDYSPLKVEASFSGFDSKLETDGIEVRCIPVDHSCPASCSYLISASEANIVYTGDFRKHGITSELEGFKENAFWEKAGEYSRIDLLVLDATNLGRIVSPLTESDVEDHLAQLAFRHRNMLIVVDMSIVDHGRLLTVIRAARRSKREVLLEERIGKLAAEWIAKEVLKGSTPKIGDEIARARSDGTLAYEKVEDVLKDVEKEPGRYFLSIPSYESIKWLRRIWRKYRDLARKTIYVISRSEPNAEEGELRFSRLLSWLRMMGIPLYTIRASGHALPYALKDIIEHVKPRYVVPVHSVNPEALLSLVPYGVKPLIPSLGHTYRFRDGKLAE